MSAQDRGWGPPRPFGHIDLVLITPAGMRLRVHRKVAPIFTRFIEEAVAKGFRFNRVADDWGHNYRPIRGYTIAQAQADPDLWSNHAWGLAVDLDATQNPMATRLRTTFPGWIDELADRYGLRWGGDYTGDRKDPMHFEVVLTPLQADALSRRLQAADQGGLRLDADVKARFNSIDTQLATIRAKVEAGYNLTAEKAGAVVNHVLGAVGASKEAVLAALQVLPPPDVDEDAVAAKVKELLDAEGVAVDTDSILDALRANPLAPISTP